MNMNINSNNTINDNITTDTSVSSNENRIYVIYHTPYIQIPSEAFTPIYVRSKIGDCNTLASDTLDNIVNENPLYAEFTTFYWVWKNDLTSKYVGFFQYKRFLSFIDTTISSDNIDSGILNYGWSKNNLDNLVKDYDILLPSAMDFAPKSVMEQYIGYHGNIFIDAAINIINRKYSDFSQDCIDVLYKSKGYFCNMFIMRRDLFNEYMHWIIDIFEEMKIILNPDYNIKHFAYVGERLFSCYIYHLRRTRNLRVKELPLVLLTPKENDATFTAHIN